MDSINPNKLFRKYNKEILNYVLSRVGYRMHIAEDLTQEIFLRVVHSKESYDPHKGSVRTWLYIITKRRVIDYFRANKGITVEFDENDLPLVTATPEKGVETDEMLNKIKRCLAQMSEKDRELITLRYINELSPKEIAQIKNVSQQSLRTALSRALTKLRKLITKLNENE